jgi:hypothetical protein
MQTHRFVHRRPTASETGQTNATRLLVIAKHLDDRDAAGKIVKRVKRGLYAIARGHERDFVEAGYGDQWHGLYRFGERGKAIRHVVMSREEARQRNETIKDLGMEWAQSNPIR